MIRITTIMAPALLLATWQGAAVNAQTTTKTDVSSHVSHDDGVATRTTKVEHVTKHKTRRPKKILGVKVGHKTITHKTVHETKASSNGDVSTVTKRQ